MLSWSSVGIPDLVSRYRITTIVYTVPQLCGVVGVPGSRGPYSMYCIEQNRFSRLEFFAK